MGVAQKSRTDSASGWAQQNCGVTLQHSLIPVRKGEAYAQQMGAARKSRTDSAMAANALVSARNLRAYSPTGPGFQQREWVLLFCLGWLVWRGQHCLLAGTHAAGARHF